MNIANLVYVEESEVGYNIRLSSVKGANHSQTLQFFPKKYSDNDRVARWNAVVIAQHYFNSLLDTLEEVSDKEFDGYKVKLIREDDGLGEEPKVKDYSDVEY
jgi:hypothetical protein